MTDSWQNLAERSTFAGTFRIIRALDDDARQDALYVAEHIETGRQVCLRLIDPKLVSSPTGKARLSELRAMRARVRSAHVVDLLATGVDRTTGCAWFALTFLHGDTLAEYAGAPLTPTETVEIMRQVGHGLSAIHEAGGVHGRLDPSRAIVAASQHADARFTVTLLDYWNNGWPSRSGAAQIGAEAMLYVAPECLQTTVIPTAAADVWSFGLLAYRLLTGVSFWETAGHTPLVVDDIRQEVSAAWIPRASTRTAVALPAGFDAWFERCVVRDVGARFESIEAALNGLRELVGDAPVRAKPLPSSAPRATAVAPRSSSPSRVGAWLRSSDFTVPAVLALLLGVSLGARSYIRSKWPPPRGPRTPAVALATPTPTPTAPAAAPNTQPVTLTDSGAAAMARRLGSIPRGSPVWISVAANDRAADALAARLQSIFETAGWVTHPVQQSQVRARPGIFLFAADERSPSYVETVERALTDGNLRPTTARGYTAFYRDKVRENPSYQGFPFEPGQSFLIVVGRGQ